MHVYICDNMYIFLQSKTVQFCRQRERKRFRLRGATEEVYYVYYRNNPIERMYRAVATATFLFKYIIATLIHLIVNSP